MRNYWAYTNIMSIRLSQLIAQNVPSKARITAIRIYACRVIGKTKDMTIINIANKHI